MSQIFAEHSVTVGIVKVFSSIPRPLFWPLPVLVLK
jgi:hypothetical protein